MRIGEPVPGVAGSRSPGDAPPGATAEELAGTVAAVLVLRARRAARPAPPVSRPHSEWVRSGRLAARRTWVARSGWRWAGRLPGRPRT